MRASEPAAETLSKRSESNGTRQTSGPQAAALLHNYSRKPGATPEPPLPYGLSSLAQRGICFFSSVILSGGGPAAVVEGPLFPPGCSRPTLETRNFFTTHYPLTTISETAPAYLPHLALARLGQLGLHPLARHAVLRQDQQPGYLSFYLTVSPNAWFLRASPS